MIHFINECEHSLWQQITLPEFLWEAELSATSFFNPRVAIILVLDSAGTLLWVLSECCLSRVGKSSSVLSPLAVCEQGWRALSHEEENDQVGVRFIGGHLPYKPVHLLTHLSNSLQGSVSYSRHSRIRSDKLRVFQYCTSLHEMFRVTSFVLPTNNYCLQGCKANCIWATRGPAQQGRRMWCD